VNERKKRIPQRLRLYRPTGKFEEIAADRSMRVIF